MWMVREEDERKKGKEGEKNRRGPLADARCLSLFVAGQGEWGCPIPLLRHAPALLQVPGVTVPGQAAGSGSERQAQRSPNKKRVPCSPPPLDDAHALPVPLSLSPFSDPAAAKARFAALGAAFEAEYGAKPDLYARSPGV